MHGIVAHVAIPVLSCLTLAISWLLRHVLTETVSIEPHQQQKDHVDRPECPDFDGVLQGTHHRITRAELIPPPDQLASLLFTLPSAFSNPRERARMRYIRDRVNADTPGRTHLVCMDTEVNCVAFVADILRDEAVPVILDTDLTISKRFEMEGRVLAVYVDSNGRIERRGGEFARPE